MDAIGQVSAVAGVLVLLLGTLWWLRRRGFAALAWGGRSAARRMECLERLALSPQHSLHLVRLDDTELVVSASPGGCRLVHTRPRAESVAR